LTYCAGVTPNEKAIWMAGKPTLHDVAAMSGVSPRTVSRVVNDEPGFSEDTRERVLRVIRELGYRPNLAARSLITRRTKTFGFVVTDLTDPFFPEIAQSVISAARDRGYTLFIAASNDDAETQSDIFDSLLARAVEAAIVFPAYDSYEALVATADAGLPLVVVDYEISHPGIATVSSDLTAGAVLATQYLIEAGHRTIGMLAYERSQPHRRRREHGFTRALDDAGLGHDASMIARSDPTVDGGRAAIRKLLASAPEVTAVFAYNDLMAMGAIAELRDQGCNVPEDIAVVGFDDIPLVELMTPAITSVRLDRERVGNEAVKLAVALSNDPTRTPDPVVLGVELVRRDSA